MKPVEDKVKMQAENINVYSVVIWVLSLVVPVLVLPEVVDNAFNTPKTLLILIGVSAIAALYAVRFLAGRPVRITAASTPRILVLLVFLNLFSFFFS